VRVTSTTYEADGQTKLISYANGVATSFAYDPERRWLDAIHSQKAGGAVLQNLGYTHDNAGRITTVESTTDWGTWNYTYDNLDRLTFADNIGHDTLDQSFTYALNGNMLSNSKLGSYSYPPPTLPRPHAPLIAGPRNYTGACPRA
jgi:YD repeat-containing protein